MLFPAKRELARAQARTRVKSFDFILGPINIVNRLHIAFCSVFTRKKSPEIDFGGKIKEKSEMGVY